MFRRLRFTFLVVALVLIFPTRILAHSAVQVVKITQDGFEPNEAITDNNSTIIFLNEDSKSHWPASNPHPTHDLYPEFDPKREIKAGDSWSFKPTKPGIWKYHDHLNPHIKGVLTVTKEEEGRVLSSESLSIFELLKTKVQNLVQKITHLFASKKGPNEFKAMSGKDQIKTLKGIASSDGSERAWQYLKETFKGESGATGNIHDLAHLAGNLIYKERGIGGISSCSKDFAFGCYHGFLDIAFSESLKDLPLAERGCEGLGQINSGPYGSCIHGIGHGIASFNKTRGLPESLLECDRLTNGQTFCYDGVFMEFVRGAPQSFYKKGDPLYPCDNLEKEFGEKFSLSCGRNQPPLLMGRFGLKFDDVSGLCKKSKLNSQFKDACFSALGFSLVSSQDENTIIRGCESIGDNFYTSRCLQAAAGELIFQDVPGWQEKSFKVCSASSPAFLASCQEHIKILIKDYGKNPDPKFSLLTGKQDKNEYVRQQMGICWQNGGADNCYETVASLFSKQLGLKETLRIFHNNENYPEIYARCHEATHYLSRFEYQKVKDIPSVYRQCDSTCHGGCYHGTLEEYLKEKNLAPAALQEEFPKICGSQNKSSSPLVFNECMHGLGHAAMFVTDAEVPASLSLCDRLDGQDPKERCWSGVFMENSSSSTNNDHPGKYTRSNDPLYPCDNLDQKYAHICYRYQSSYFALLENHDWRKVAELCLKVPSPYQNECFLTIGTNQVGFTQDEGEMRKNCDLMPTNEFKETCIKGIVSSFAYRFVGDDKKISNFCLQVNHLYQKPCFRQMGTAVVDWSNNPKKRIQICNRIKNIQYASWCKEA